MVNYPIVKQTVREVYKQSSIVLPVFVVAVLFFLLVFTFRVKYEGDVIVSMSFMGATFDETMIHDAYAGIPLFYRLFKYIFMFLIIIQSSAIFVDTLKNPLLGVFLTKPVSRTNFLISKYLGEIIAIFTLLLIAGVGVVLILYFKMKETIFLTPIYLCLLTFYTFVALFSFMTFLSFVIENSLVVASVGILIYFVLAPLILWGEMSGNRLAYLGYIFPPVWKLDQIETDILEGNSVNPSIDIFVLILFYILVYTSLSAIIFNRKDIT